MGFDNPNKILGVNVLLYIIDRAQLHRLEVAGDLEQSVSNYDVLLKPLREEDVVREVLLAWSYWNSTRRASVLPASDRDAGRIRK